MCLATGEEIGLEMHDQLDQFIRVESGSGAGHLGPNADEMEIAHEIADDWAVIIPAGDLAQRDQHRDHAAAALLHLRPG